MNVKQWLPAGLGLILALNGLGDPIEEATYSNLYGRAKAMVAPKTTIEKHFGTEGKLEVTGGKRAEAKGEPGVTIIPNGETVELVWTDTAAALEDPETVTYWQLSFTLEAPAPLRYRVYALENGRFNRKGDWRNFTPGTNGAVDERIFSQRTRYFEEIKKFGGVKLEISGKELAGQRLQFKNIRVQTAFRTGYFRREFTLPADELWSAVAEIGNRTVAYINGREVKDTSAITPRPFKGGGAMYESKRLDLLPYLKPGQNVIALASDQMCYFQASAITVSGNQILLDGGAGWKYALHAPANWYAPDYNDSSWGAVREATVNIYSMLEKAKDAPDTAEAYPATGYGFYYREAGDLPAYDGLIQLANPYDQKFYYSARKPFQIDLRLPAGLAAQAPELAWQILKFTAAKTYDPVASGTAAAFKKDGNSLRARVESQALAGGVYLFAAQLKAGGKILETRVPEPFVVASKVEMQPVAGNALEEGLQLTLEKTIDFTDPAGPDPWMETDAKGPRPSGKWDEKFYHTVDKPLIVERHGLKYRETRENYMAQFTYQIAFDHPGDWYLMVLEYPDDAERWIAVTCNTSTRMNYLPTLNMDSAACTKCGPSIWTGGKYPNTGKMLEMKWLYRPNPGPHGINVISLMKKQAAAAAKLRIYRIAGHLPALALPAAALRDERQFGTLTERTAPFSGYFNYFTIEAKLPEGAGRNDRNALREACARLALQLDAAEHWAEYMRFAGQNVHLMGCYQYDDRNTCPQLLTGSPRLQPNCRDVAARVFQENDLGFYASIEFGATYRRKMATPDPADRFFDRTGKMLSLYNFLRPDIEGEMLRVAEQLAAEFKDQPNFLGINWFAYFGGTSYWSPGFRESDLQTDPLAVGYDDFTIGLFEKETGVTVPGAKDAPARFEKRYAFLTSPEMQPRWIAWRAGKLHGFFTKLLSTIRAVRPDLVCIANLNIDFPHIPQWQATGKPFGQYLREWGWDTELFAKSPGLRLMPQIQGNARYQPAARTENYAMGWQAGHDAEYYKPFAALDPRALMIRYGWLELEGIAAHFPMRKGWPRPAQQTPMGQAREEMAMEPFTQAMIGLDPQLIAFGFTDASPYVGIEDVQRKFSRVFLRLPPGNFEPIAGTGFDSNLALRALRRDGRYYLVAANPGYWPIQGRITLEKAPSVKDLVTGAAGEANRIKVALPPFGIAAFVADAPDARVTGWETEAVPEPELAHMRQILAQAQKALGTGGMSEFLGAQDFNFLKTETAKAAASLAAEKYAAAWHTLTQAGYWHVLCERVADAKYAANVGAREITAVRAPQAPKIDGVLDDAIWQTCIPVTRFVRADKELSDLESWVYAAWSDNKLYLAFDYRDANPDQILGAPDTGKETEFWSQRHDYLDFFVKPTEKDYYQFAVNPSNFRFDQASRAGARDYDYAPVWKSAATIGKKGWTAEVELDTRDAFGKTIAAGDVWEINFHRFFREDATRSSSWVWNPNNWHSMEHLGRIRFVPANLLKNPSAEQMRGDFPENWCTWRSGTNCAVMVSKTEMHGGLQSIGVQLNNYDEKRDWFRASIVTAPDWKTGVPVRPNGKYDFSFWMNTTAPEINVRAFLVNADQTGWADTALDRLIPRGQGWFRYESAFETGPQAKTAALVFNLQGNNTGSRERPAAAPGTAMFIDDVLIHER